MSQLGIVISIVYGASYKEVVQSGQAAEDHGWDAVFMEERR
ncbi:MAG: hypothetical protein AB7G75_19000 [Candidatus Binatia bacterium]